MVRSQCLLRLADRTPAAAQRGRGVAPPQRELVVELPAEVTVVRLPTETEWEAAAGGTNDGNIERGQLV